MMVPPYFFNYISYMVSLPTQPWPSFCSSNTLSPFVALGLYGLAFSAQNRFLTIYPMTGSLSFTRSQFKYINSQRDLPHSSKMASLSYQLHILFPSLNDVRWQLLAIMALKKSYYLYNKSSGFCFCLYLAKWLFIPKHSQSL